ncbi:hypothetical protein ALQ30_200316 [Pseudomonas syringae pv. persicae]|uniref:Uncharacterized protein n=1 Tax=Pseudomonas syringae pv. persicae TaxID=237306 RepID=A0A3M4A7V2_9PSED|nr:hypothetical protein ALQ30_200316 [Pseudomonas syringae pv. persicae]
MLSSFTAAAMVSGLCCELILILILILALLPLLATSRSGAGFSHGKTLVVIRLTVEGAGRSQRDVGAAFRWVSADSTMRCSSCASLSNGS